MNYLATNLQVLRKHRNLTQQHVADSLTVVQDLRKVSEYHIGVLRRGYDKLSYSTQLDPFTVK